MEQQIKNSVLSTAREMIAGGLVEGTAGNLSARLDAERVILTPASLSYKTMDCSDLVITDLKGKVLEGTRQPTTEMALHLTCLANHADIAAVVHCHPVYASMFAVNREPIPSLIEEFDIHVGGDVPVADYQETGSQALATEVSRHLDERGAVLMANHGLLCVGKDLEDALSVALLVERTAKIVWGARLIGKPLALPESTHAKFSPLYKRSRRAARDDT
ncbi:MAG: class II aldolase/adducin family protein [Myxococcota bacterium]|nr:class II aldolase/adducin family protein [Myxococcota bacterium]